MTYSTVQASRTSQAARPRSAWTAAPVLLALLVSGAACGESSPQPPPEPPAVGAQTLLTGVVTREAAAVNGAELVLRAWPAEHVLAELPDGEPVPLTELARTTTTATGHFALALDPATVGAEHTSQEGWVDIELTISGASDEVLWHVTAVPATPAQQQATGFAWHNAGVDPDLLESRMAAGQAPFHLEIDLADGSVHEVGADLADEED